MPSNPRYQDDTLPLSTTSKKRKRPDEYELLPKTQQSNTNATLDAIIPEDPRLVTETELLNFISEHQLSDYDLTLLNLDSAAFTSLPIELQHEIILDLKTKSRQSTWNKVEEMEKVAARNPLDFSKMQIKNLCFRNEMSERAANFTRDAGVVVNPNVAQWKKKKFERKRVAAERNMEFVLVKNDVGDGADKAAGWIMKAKPRDSSVAVVPTKSTQKAIIVSDEEEEEEDIFESLFQEKNQAVPRSEIPAKRIIEDSEEEEVDEDFEEVKIDSEALVSTMEIDDHPLLFSPIVSPLLSQFNTSPRVSPEIQIVTASEGMRECEDLSMVLQKFTEAYKDSGPSDPAILLNRQLSMMLRNKMDSPELEPTTPPMATLPIEDLSDTINPYLDYPKYLVKQSETNVQRYWESQFPPESNQINQDENLTVEKIIKKWTDEEIDDGIERFGRRVEKLSVEDERYEEKMKVWNFWVGCLSSVSLWRQHSRAVSVGSDVESSHSVDDFGAGFEDDDLFEAANGMEGGDQGFLTEDSVGRDSVFPGNEKVGQVFSNDNQIEADEEVDHGYAEENLPYAYESLKRLHLKEAGISIQKLPKQTEIISDENDMENDEEDLILEELESADDGITEAIDVPTSLTREESEFARFVSSLQNKSVETVTNELESEVSYLRMQKSKSLRDSSGINNDMIRDTQDLLRVFGIPYIVAPMEAESQCAWLSNKRMVDGIVTDDSDVFLFGGDVVYKNMFNQNRFVECYKSDEIEKETRFTREKLIRFAFLLGSDYTEGIKGVGSVLATEILNEWDGEEGLKKFGEWFREVEKSVVIDAKKFDKSKRKFLKLAKRTTLPKNFPDPRVEAAYLKPQVNEDITPIQWGMPNLQAVRKYMEDKLRWDEKKTDEVLLPVIRETNRRMYEGPSKQQQTLEKFFENVDYGSKTSKKRKKEPKRKSKK
ncbi:DNA repair protein rad2 [Nowakowskiella sp. JEL0407]|nr:DNA repair protein rad2 [Nowakowskiella sp. JEL0407]